MPAGAPLFALRGVDKLMWPGEDGQPVDAIGHMLDRGRYEAMLKEYYALRGWEEDTGTPTSETLAKLGMEDVTG
jgi:aldehyde:ferredoxin oxidoreductase